MVSDTGDDGIVVEVVYARPEAQVLVALRVPPRTTAERAVLLSGIPERFPEIDLQRSRLGIFGKAVAGDTPLRANDRVEVYRPLVVDPKQTRRQRAKMKPD